MSANSFDKLAQCFSRLPGIGEKTALRLAFFMLKSKVEFAGEFAQALSQLHQEMIFCAHCQNLSDVSPCSICADSKRDQQVILVVESPQDLIALEKTHEYRGTYHVLHGALSPINGVHPDDLKIRELLARLSSQNIEEIILATNPNVEGEATSLYLYRLLKPFSLKVTRLPAGVPVGSGIEFLDPLTLQRALQGRHLFSH